MPEIENSSGRFGGCSIFHCIYESLSRVYVSDQLQGECPSGELAPSLDPGRRSLLRKSTSLYGFSETLKGSEFLLSTDFFHLSDVYNDEL